MVLSGKIDFLTRFYAYSMLLYVLALADVTWLDSLSYNVGIRLYIIVVCIVKMAESPFVIQSRWKAPLCFLLLYCLYCMLITFGEFYQTISYIALFLSMMSIITLKIGEKRFLLNVFTVGFVVILVISLIGWILFLLGVNLPHSGLINHRNGYHVYYDYYFFRISSGALYSIFPRFSSVFLEPGQLATPCAFLFFLNAIENKIFGLRNVVLLVAIVLSFSLIAYGLLVFSLVMIAWFKGFKYRLPLAVSVVLVLAGLTTYFIYNQDSAVNELIISRLEYDEDDIIVGNNRTSQIFEANYQSFIKSGDRYLGIRKKLVTGYDWTINSSGYQKYIVHFGLFGLVFGGMLIFSIYWNNRNSKTLVFLIILVTAFIVRNLLFAPLWLSITILGFYVFGGDKTKKTFLER